MKHNDHDAQKGLHTEYTTVEKSKYPAGRVGGKLHGIDDVVTTKHEDVDSDLPHDALNHPVNREKVCWTRGSWWRLYLKPGCAEESQMLIVGHAD